MILPIRSGIAFAVAADVAGVGVAGQPPSAPHRGWFRVATVVRPDDCFCRPAGSEPAIALATTEWRGRPPSDERSATKAITSSAATGAIGMTTIGLQALVAGVRPRSRPLSAESRGGVRPRHVRGLRAPASSGPHGDHRERQELPPARIIGSGRWWIAWMISSRGRDALGVRGLSRGGLASAAVRE